MHRTLIALALSTLATLSALSAPGTAHAATVGVYTTLASWQAAVGGAVQTQDFSGYATGTDLTGVAVLPGVTLTSNLGPVQVFGAADSAVAFGPARAAGNAYYEAQYALPFLAAALDITAFEADPADPTTAQDTGRLLFSFSDGGTYGADIAGGDGSPIFFGIISDTAITSFRWTEAHEAGGGNEETGLDNLRVAQRAANELPLPGSLSLAMLALAAVPLARRRR